jgi:hypothetical protein
MALISLNLKPSDKQLREFGEISLCMLNVIGLLLLWKAGLPVKAFVILCLCGTVIFLLSRISVKLVRPVYIGLIALTFPIGWVISHTVMALFYFGIIGGIGLVFKLIRRDPLQRRYDPQAASYWIPYSRKADLKHYFHQF